MDWNRKLKCYARLISGFTLIGLHYRMKLNSKLNHSDDKNRHFPTFHLKTWRSIHCESLSEPISTESKTRINKSDQKALKSHYQYVICGAGTAAQSAVNTLSQLHSSENKDSDANTTTTSLLMIAPEWRNPYYNSPLIKNNTESNETEHNNDEVFAKNPTWDLVLGKSLKAVYADRNEIELESGELIQYDKLLIAVGAVVGIESIHSIHKLDETISHRVLGGHSHEEHALLLNEIEKKCLNNQKLHVTVVGGGWNGTLYASHLQALGCDVTLICYEPLPWSRYLPRFICEVLSKLLKAQGIELLPYSNVNYITQMKQNNPHDSQEHADLQVYFTWSYDSFALNSLRTDYLLFLPTNSPSCSGNLDGQFYLQSDPEVGGLLVNSELSAASDVYVAGDCASFPAVWAGERQRIQSNEHAEQSGLVAALNMYGSRKAYSSEPVRKVYYSALDVAILSIGKVSSLSETFCFFAKDGKTSDYTRGVIFYSDMKSNNVIGAVVLFDPMIDSPNVDSLRKLFDQPIDKRSFKDISQLEETLAPLARKVYTELHHANSEESDSLVFTYRRFFPREKGTKSNSRDDIV
uniref:FAD/NAD(P)-binding domain-containing protein n=1 Tax=Timspurckia oligopyrenoides TaxID=708627 RepID=A0A7S1ETP4_9RHOD|mmetsp:Transcript_796/g.1467  ORF Transcript_796/g.1467 Transcript_796/m.1467 type:complete len:579 (+) Transcript_796:494-2230(+)